MGTLCLLFPGEKMEAICGDHGLWKRLMLCSYSEVSVTLPVTSVAKSLNSPCPSSHRGVVVRRAYTFSPRCTTQSDAHIKSIQWYIALLLLTLRQTFWPVPLSLPKARRMCLCPQVHWWNGCPIQSQPAVQRQPHVGWFGFGAAHSSTPVAPKTRHIPALFCRSISVILEYEGGPSEQYANHFPCGTRNLLVWEHASHSVGKRNLFLKKSSLKCFLF